MRSLFCESDLISAEIQNISSDGLISLHTRSLKYGKLENGQLISVPSTLVKRLPQLHLTLALDVEIDLILGKNGLIWITRSTPGEWKSQQDGVDDFSAPLVETLQRLRLRHATTPLLPNERMAVARVRNSIEVLSILRKSIDPDAIIAVYQHSLKINMKPKVKPIFIFLYARFNIITILLMD